MHLWISLFQKKKIKRISPPLINNVGTRQDGDVSPRGPTGTRTQYLAASDDQLRALTVEPCDLVLFTASNNAIL
jgi:hypothetical protein